MNSKAFLIHFCYWFQNNCYAEQFPCVSIRLFFEIAIFLKSNFSEQLFFITATYSNSHQTCSAKKLFFKILQYSKKTAVLQSRLFLINTDFRAAATLIKKRLQHRCFPANIAKFLRTAILKNICERLLL